MIMEELRKLLNEQLNKDFGSAVLSGAHDKTGVTKVRVRPLIKRENCSFSWSLSATIRHFMRTYQ